MGPNTKRSFSFTTHRPQPHHTVTEDDDFANIEVCYSEHGRLICPVAPNPHGDLPVYMTIHRIRRLVLDSIDDPYTWEQLRDPRMNMLVVRPLVDRLYDPEDVSIVYCLLANRLQFQSEQSYRVHQGVSNARATLCELLASRILRRFHEDNPGRAGLLLLANVLVAGFDPFQGAPEGIEHSGRRFQWPIQDRGGYEKMFTALELAIVSESKHLASSSAFQRLVNAVHSGKVVYTPLSPVDILPDHYKHKAPSLYNPRMAPVLDHYRLIVPRTRTIVEALQFVLLLLLYILLMTSRGSANESFYELVFGIYAVGWILEEFAALLEHGWNVHLQKLWAFLDLTFVVIFGVYLCLRFDLVYGHHYSRRDALNVLCTAAPVLLPRLAFILMPENIVFLSLHAMMKDFTRLTVLAVWCFTGFLLALQWLIDGDVIKHHGDKNENGDDKYEPPNWATIVKWLLWLWFGLDGTGIERSVEFSSVVGPALMVSFTFLGSTLFLTILVAMLTNTFSAIAADQIAEIHFRRAVLTFEGVKSDSIFAYPPPFNILALCTMLPLKFFLSPRWFHKVNVSIIRALNAPLLLAISVYERRRLWRVVQRDEDAEYDGRTGRRKWRLRELLSCGFTGFSPHGDVKAVFETLPVATREVIERMDSEGASEGSDGEDGEDESSDDATSPYHDDPNHSDYNNPSSSSSSNSKSSATVTDGADTTTSVKRSAGRAKTSTQNHQNQNGSEATGNDTGMGNSTATINSTGARNSTATTQRRKKKDKSKKCEKCGGSGKSRTAPRPRPGRRGRLSSCSVVLSSTGAMEREER